MAIWPSLTVGLLTHSTNFSERCRSGLTGSTGNAVNGEPFRGFESHPFRHVSEARASARARSATGLSYGRVSDTRLSTGPDATIRMMKSKLSQGMIVVALVFGVSSFGVT